MTENHWLDSPKGEYHKRLWPYLQQLEQAQSYRRRQNELFLSLYGDAEAGAGLGPRLLMRRSGSEQPRLALNVCKSICDTAQAKIAQNRNLPFMLTEDGNWLQQQKAKQLNRFVEGMFYDTGYWETAQQVFLDACISGTGFHYAFDADPNGKGKVALERPFFDEIKVDDALGLHGDPPEIHRVHPVSKRAYAAQYKKGTAQYKAIMAASPAKAGQRPNAPQSEDLIEVAVTWRKASREGAGDGVEVHCLENATLEVLPWRHNWLPIVPFRWQRQPLGYFGRGIISQLVGIQYEINTLLRVISKSIRMVGVPRVLNPTQSKINPALFTDEIATIIPYNGGFKPEIMMGQILQPEVYNWLTTLVQKAYEIVGINELSATGKKPPGLNAAVALQSYNDLQGERFSMVEQNWERLGISTSRCQISLAKDIADERGDYQISAHNSKGFERISWKEDINLEMDDVIFKQQPVNLFAKTPSAKQQQVLEMFDKGAINVDEYRRLVQYPDLEAVTTITNAATDAVYRIVTLIIEKGIYTPPEAFLNLEAAVPIVHGALLKYSATDAPPERLDMLRTWLAQAKDTIDKSKAEAMRQQQAMAPRPAAPSPDMAAPPPADPMAAAVPA